MHSDVGEYTDKYMGCSVYLEIYYLDKSQTSGETAIFSMDLTYVPTYLKPLSSQH